jgi:hypothetical protein
VSRKKFRLALGNLSELTFESIGDARVERTSWLAQQRAISSILHQCVLEEVSRVRRHTLAEQQPCLNETVKRRLEFHFRLARHRSQQRMRKLSTKHRSNLCHLLGRTKPIKPRHQRSVQACRDRH